MNILGHFTKRGSKGVKRGEKSQSHVCQQYCFKIRLLQDSVEREEVTEVDDALLEKNRGVGV